MYVLCTCTLMLSSFLSTSISKKLQRTKGLENVTDPSVSTQQPISMTPSSSADTKAEQDESASTTDANQDEYEEMDAEATEAQTYAALSKETMSEEHQYSALSKCTPREEHYMPLSKLTLTEHEYYTALMRQN